MVEGSSTCECQSGDRFEIDIEVTHTECSVTTTDTTILYDETAEERFA